MSRKLSTYLMALATVTLWGASFPLSKAALATVGPTSLAFLRWAISAGVLIGWVSWSQRGQARPGATRLGAARILLQQEWHTGRVDGAGRDCRLLLAAKYGDAVYHGHQCRHAVEPDAALHGADRNLHAAREIAPGGMDRRRDGLRQARC